MRKGTKEVLAEEALPPKTRHKPKRDDGWWPDLGPSQMDVFNCNRPIILTHGERYSGKSIGCLNRCTRLGYEYSDNVIIISGMTLTASQVGGAWEKLTAQIVPTWEENIDIRMTEPRMDTAHNWWFFLSTIDGLWSKFILRSINNASQISGRFKQMEFGCIYFDEITEGADARYFLKPLQQLGRRLGHNGKKIPCQQFIAACNPPDEGEDHWVYKTMIVPFNEGNPKYFVKHIPISENRWVDAKEYQETYVMPETVGDPTAYDRLILGKWVRKPTGKGIFSEFFDRTRHVIGDRKKGLGIVPYKGIEIDIGIDTGTANPAVAFSQRLILPDGTSRWSIFDAVVNQDKKSSWALPVLVPKILQRLNFWCGRVGYPFKLNWISDLAAFTIMNSDGSYDSRKIEELVAAELKHRERYPHLAHIQEIRMNGCPKGKGSVEARVKLFISMLTSGELLCSDLCESVIDMFYNLEKDKTGDERTVEATLPFKPKRSKHIHIFDAASYSAYFYAMGLVAIGPTEAVTSEFVTLNNV